MSPFGDTIGTFSKLIKSLSIISPFESSEKSSFFKFDIFFEPM